MSETDPYAAPETPEEALERVRIKPPRARKAAEQPAEPAEPEQPAAPAEA